MTPAEIRARRQALGLSQRELAALLPTSRRSVESWESEGGEHRSPPGYLWRALRDLERELAEEQPPVQ